jgi:hypothetical protein
METFRTKTVYVRKAKIAKKHVGEKYQHQLHVCETACNAW